MSKPKKGKHVITPEDFLKLVSIGPLEVPSRSLIRRKLSQSKDPRAKAALKALREGKL